MEIIRPAESVNLLPPKNKEINKCDFFATMTWAVGSFTFLGPIFVNWQISYD